MTKKSPAISDDWRPTAAWPALRLRAELLARLRSFFASRGFLEVETPLLSADVAVDLHLHPLAVTVPGDPRRPDDGRRMWLQTSPEFCMKRLLAAGAEAIYQITRAFRGGEAGTRHNLEFTIVEWYRRGDSMADGMQLLSDLAECALALGPAKSVSYADAMQRHAGVDAHRDSSQLLAAAAHANGLAVPGSMSLEDRDAWLNLLLVELVEPHLGRGQPTILFDYPASQAALAQIRAGNPPVAERFELYVEGVELANGYHELQGADELLARNRAANRRRTEAGLPELPIESRLIAAMHAGLPQSTGVALGFDRLVMLAARAAKLSDVTAFPLDRA